jgi:hypothetical protein
VASIEPGYNSPNRLRDGKLKFDATSRNGRAAAGFVQRPGIPPRRQPVWLRGPLDIAAEYRANVEPVFGMIKSVRGIRKFLLRGLEKVSAEWQLICLTHNLLKIWRRARGVAGG